MDEGAGGLCLPCHSHGLFKVLSGGSGLSVYIQLDEIRKKREGGGQENWLSGLFFSFFAGAFLPE